MTRLANLMRIARFTVVGAAMLATAGCTVGVEPGYGYDADYPPDAYVATTSPIYFEGRPTYYYHDRWYYRDGRRWAYYRREPAGLQQRRVQAPPPARRNYESWRGRPAPARPAPGRPAPQKRDDHHGWR